MTATPLSTTPAPTEISSVTRDARWRGAAPRIIQGGMGVAVSGWPLARAVASVGQLGVVSGTALDVVCARRLQDGDTGGHVRRALAAFPVPRVAEWILDAYFVEGGIAPREAYRPVPRHTVASGEKLLELTVAANFVEVFLAKEGHEGLVGVNYLHKIDLPLPAACFGALLAGVDVVLVGAGNPADIPALVRGLATGKDVSLAIKVMGSKVADGPTEVLFRPRSVVPGAAVRPVPLVLAIIASNDLASGLVADPATRPDGFVVEGPSAGGHNAPPRGPRALDGLGQPVYGERDEVDIASVVALGLPVWVAGGRATPGGLRAALASGAAGIQAGTVFAYSDESGFADDIKAQVREGALRGDLLVRADWRVSPTGFPFRVAELPGTLTDPEIAAARQPVCDLGVLRSAYRRPDGRVDFRCPAEPQKAYLRKGGREANREGRVCLCNALLAGAGLPQRRPKGAVEPALVTAGGDLAPVVTMLGRRRAGASGYTAAEVVAHLLTGAEPEASTG